MVENRWTHRAEADHPVDPHYETTGRPGYWVCHSCRTVVLLDGRQAPIAVTAVRAASTDEPAMSAQP